MEVIWQLRRDSRFRGLDVVNIEFKITIIHLDEPISLPRSAGGGFRNVGSLANTEKISAPRLQFRCILALLGMDERQAEALDGFLRCCTPTCLSKCPSCLTSPAYYSSTLPRLINQ